MACNPIVWFEIYVQDMKRAKTFYEAVLGISLTKLDSPTPGLEMLAFPSRQEVYGATGALVKIEGCAPSGGGTLVYFACDDCAVEAARAANNGGRILKDKFSIGQYGFIALAHDTEGNMIGFHSM